MPQPHPYPEAVASFVARAKARYTRHIDQVFLFGSVARKEARKDSDIDLLVLWKGDLDEGWRAMAGIAFDILLETGTYISVKVMRSGGLTGKTAFERNVMAEGMTVA